MTKRLASELRERMRTLREEVVSVEDQRDLLIGLRDRLEENLRKEALVKRYVKAAEQGDADAQNNLGLAYANGEGVEKNDKEAVKWCQKAAEQGLADAQNNLGVVYDKGAGVLEDDKEAVKWYQKAAEQGQVNAQYNLGWMYANGRGVEQNYVTAYAWWNIPAANADKIAKEFKPTLAKKMTPDQIAKAQELSKEMVKKNPKLLEK